jgi:hypothetical protein
MVLDLAIRQQPSFDPHPSRSSFAKLLLYEKLSVAGRQTLPAMTWQDIIALLALLLQLIQMFSNLWDRYHAWNKELGEKHAYWSSPPSKLISDHLQTKSKDNYLYTTSIVLNRQGLPHVKCHPKRIYQLL